MLPSTACWATIRGHGARLGRLAVQAPRCLRNPLCRCVSTNLYGHRRSGISTDEIACAYKTKQSFDATGIHFATKQKMCTWLHCEPDSSVTGIAPYTAKEYSFFHLAYGQVGASAEVLEPKEGGFSKRFHIAFANYKSHGDPDQPANDSKAFILGYHDWLAAHALIADAPVEDGIAASVENGGDGTAASVMEH